MSEFQFPSVLVDNARTLVFNHSSAHSFTFADGSVLPGVTKEQSQLLSGGDVVTPVTKSGRFVIVEMGCSDVLARSLDEVQQMCDCQDPSCSGFVLFLVPYPYLTASWWDTDRWPSGVAGYSGPGRPAPGTFPPLLVDRFRVSPKALR